MCVCVCVCGHYGLASPPNYTAALAPSNVPILQTEIDNIPTKTFLPQLGGHKACVCVLYVCVCVCVCAD